MDKSAALQSASRLYFRCSNTACWCVSSLCSPAARRQLKALPDLTFSPARRGGSHTCEKRVRRKKKNATRGEELELSERSDGEEKKSVLRSSARARAECANGKGCVKGVNKVRRAVSKATTNQELGLEPSQRPTHPSIAPFDFFFPLLPTSIRWTA